MNKMFTVHLNPNENGIIKEFDNFESAAKFWDIETAANSEIWGYIGIKVWQYNNLVRDGRILYKFKDGTVYINPLLDRE